VLTDDFEVTAPTYNGDGQYTAPVVLFAFLIGSMCCKSLVVIKWAIKLTEKYNSYDDELCDRSWCFDDVSLAAFFVDLSPNFALQFRGPG